MTERRFDLERRRDVRRVIAAGQKIIASSTVVAELARSTGLSAESVDYALTHCLERDVHDAELSRLLEWAGDEVGEVAVILSAGVFTSALRAIALAFAVAPSVVVRPSHRDARFASMLVDALDERSVRLAPDLDVQSYKGSEVHLYGSDATIAELRAKLAATTPAVRIRAHGHGFGLALVAGDAPDLAARFADDVVAFDQRGCLSPRVAFVVGEARASSFAAALHEALGQRESERPRGAIDADERALAVRYAESVSFAGNLYKGDTHLVGLTAGSIVLPPVGRNLHVVAVPDVDAARDLIAPYRRFVTAIGSDDRRDFASLDLPHARWSWLGRMQMPTLDGPVDRRAT